MKDLKLRVIISSILLALSIWTKDLGFVLIKESLLLGMSVITFSLICFSGIIFSIVLKLVDDFESGKIKIDFNTPVTDTLTKSTLLAIIGSLLILITYNVHGWVGLIFTINAGVMTSMAAYYLLKEFYSNGEEKSNDH